MQGLFGLKVFRTDGPTWKIDHQDGFGDLVRFERNFAGRGKLSNQKSKREFSVDEAA